MQVVYAFNYSKVKGSLDEATSAIVVQELNLYNSRVGLAGQNLILATSNAAQTAWRAE